MTYSVGVCATLVSSFGDGEMEIQKGRVPVGTLDLSAAQRKSAQKADVGAGRLHVVVRYHTRATIVSILSDIHLSCSLRPRVKCHDFSKSKVSGRADLW
jgi:hypothetical protein